jgi:hypothetical protein
MLDTAWHDIDIILSLAFGAMAGLTAGLFAGRRFAAWESAAKQRDIEYCVRQPTAPPATSRGQ